MNTKYTKYSKLFRRMLGVTALCMVASVGGVQADSISIPSARPSIESDGDVSTAASGNVDSTASNKVSTVIGRGVVVTPNDWTYTALKTLLKHEAIKNNYGFTFDGTSYAKDDLMPLIDEVVEKREQMNDNDRQLALRMYQENMRDVMDYRIARDKKITEERRQKADEKRAERAKQTGKTYTVTPAQQEALDKANEELDKPQDQEKALTDEEIKKKMDKFTIDDSRVKVSGDVRIRYGKSDGNKSSTTGRVRTEMRFTL